MEFSTVSEANIPYQALEPLPQAEFGQLYKKMLFDEMKWDPQIGDTSTLTDFPLVLATHAWQEISGLAEQLAAEAIAVETELLHRPELHKELGLPSAVRRNWRRPENIQASTDRDVRIIRFDFHYTPEGWCISEANIDTPGGWIEASSFARLMLEHYPGLQMTGDPLEGLALAIRERLEPGAIVGLIHATSYVEDRAMMMALQKRLEATGLKGCLISPTQLHWENGQVRFETQWEQGRAAYLVRFFPAEWLCQLPRLSQWSHYFQCCDVPSSNPTTSLLVQSKRFPLVWERLTTPLPTWRKLLPQTFDPRQIRDAHDADWVLKPIFGRAGEGVAIKGLTTEKKWCQRYRQARREKRGWVLQRRFQTLPVHGGGLDWYPCIGVYTVAGHAAGIYGRISAAPITNEKAKDVAVLIAR
jgi:glutathionylspermidine synthase